MLGFLLFSRSKLWERHELFAAGAAVRGLTKADQLFSHGTIQRRAPKRKLSLQDSEPASTRAALAKDRLPWADTSLVTLRVVLRRLEKRTLAAFRAQSLTRLRGSRALHREGVKGSVMMTGICYLAPS